MSEDKRKTGSLKDSSSHEVSGSTSIVSVSRLVKTFPQLSHPVLNGVSLEVPSGGLTLVMGRSGSGKSTLLHCIAGLESFQQGEVVVDGNSLSGCTVEELAKIRLETIGIVFQFFNLIGSMSVEQNVLLPAHLAGTFGEKVRESAKELLELMEIDHLAVRFPHEISGGEAQRVAIARALLLEPKILLADEPTGNLDRQSAEKVFSLFQRIVAEKELSVLMVSHDESFRPKAERVYEMDDLSSVGLSAQ